MTSNTLSFSARFERISRRDDLYDWPTRGVYLHYGGTKPSRPARIGEGWIDQRALASWNGATRWVLAADLGRYTKREAKQAAVILEWLLLEAYYDRHGRLPRRNAVFGKSRVVVRALKRRRRIRFTLRGYNPLTGRRLPRPLTIVVTRDADGYLCWTWG